MMMQLAALITNGDAMPDGSGDRIPGNVIYQAAEDGIEDTIKPRLEAAGADCSRIAFLEQSDEEPMDCRYKILGHKITHEGETIYVFDLLETEIFMDTKRKKRVAEGTILPETVNQEEQALSDKEKAAIADEEKAIKKRNRIPFYPSDWKDSFGLPVEEHKKALEINMCEGYVELTSCR